MSPKQTKQPAYIIHTRYQAVMVETPHTSYYGNYSTFLELSININVATVKKASDIKADPDGIHYRLARDLKDNLANWQGTWVNHITPEAHAAAMKALEKLLRTKRAHWTAAAKHPAFKEMKAIVAQVMKNYLSDFNYHDRLILGEYKPTRFVWIVGTSHTHLLLSRNNWTTEVLNYSMKNNPHDEFYTWNGRSLDRVTPIQAIKYSELLPTFEN